MKKGVAYNQESRDSVVDYKEYNDFELLYLICEHNEEAYEILYKKYKFVVEMKARKYFKYTHSKGLEYNDLEQEGMIGLSEAIRDFKIKKDVKFSTFANICIERQIIGAVQSANRKKHKILNDSISLDESFVDNDKPLRDFLFDDKASDPSSYLIEQESSKETYFKIKDSLTALEKEVFDLKLNNFDYKEISLILGRTYKSVDSAIQRIKGKMRKIMEL